MRSSTLNELPPPPPEKTGWPWTEESPQLPDTMPDGSSWPRISIVTPSYNQGQFIEETIRSVLLQGYPNLEYIIIDGGSTDQSVEIIKKYEPWLAYWVSEGDRGQSHAINKGLERVTGKVFAWLNSDDTYLPGALLCAADWVEAADDASALLYGACDFVDAHSRKISTWLPKFLTMEDVMAGATLPQPTCFLRAQAVQDVGMLRPNYHFALDYDLFLRLRWRYQFDHTDAVIATYRLHDNSKTVAFRQEFVAEKLRAITDFFALDELPQHIMGLQGRAKGVQYLSASLTALCEDDVVQAGILLGCAHDMDSTLTPADPDWAKWVQIHGRMTDTNKADALILELERISIPIYGNYSCHWRHIRRRVRLLQGNYCSDSLVRSIKIWGDLAEATLTDPSWVAQARVFPVLLRLGLGNEVFGKIYRLYKYRSQYVKLCVCLQRHNRCEKAE